MRLSGLLKVKEKSSNVSIPLMTFELVPAEIDLVYQKLLKDYSKLVNKYEEDISEDVNKSGGHSHPERNGLPMLDNYLRMSVLI